MGFVISSMRSSSRRHSAKNSITTMNTPRISTGSHLSRRTFLHGMGVSLSLPFLESMQPVFAGTTEEPARRMIAIETNQGILPRNFFPAKAGRNFDLPRYLKQLKEHQDHLTVLSGVSHPEVDGGHKAEDCFLTAAPHPGRGGFRNTISLDQYAAERIGHLTRFPSLALSVNTQESISYTGAGVQIPGMDRPSRIFQQLFIQGSAKEVEAHIHRLKQGQSILDSVAERARTLQRRVGHADREKLEAYFTGVREMEQRLAKNEEWEYQPKPKVGVKSPKDINDKGALIERTRAIYDLAQLALQTDSTRLISVYIYQNAIKPNIPGVDEATHPLTHHGNRPDKLEQLSLIEEAQFKALSSLLDGLSAHREQGRTLLDQTMVLYGTCMGNANAHTNDNLPVLLAGGRFQHGQHLAFDRDRNYPLPNLFVSMLQSLGIETGHFATATGTLRGLEMI